MKLFERILFTEKLPYFLQKIFDDLNFVSPVKYTIHTFLNKFFFFNYILLTKKRLMQKKGIFKKKKDLAWDT